MKPLVFAQVYAARQSRQGKRGVDRTVTRRYRRRVEEEQTLQATAGSAGTRSAYSGASSGV